MRLSRLVPALVFALVAALPATADAAQFKPEPWRPFHSTPVTLPGGLYCAFDLNLDIVADDEQIRVDSRYPDGTVHVNEYRGKLIVNFVGNGKSAERDLSGTGWEELYPDGVNRKSFTVVGPFGARFKTGDDYPQGYYRFDGFTVITFDPDGRRHVPVHVGSREDMCHTLS
ncbi:hypothetical protein [Actinocrispum wychmicini]|uniref:Uncharacterized protein n=1 Tax=Actinocrispum wychmicini TaxID=1213861 RepID=A0A4R2JFB6_9PSEU|nr:hypothetical protein [Actinocrispum wychmicini]TCO54959.1 hypothetical protein EV192_108247 [Actinocrispum wychmicini]